MTTEVFETATGNQFAVFISAGNAIAAARIMPGFDVRNGPRLDVPRGLIAERFPICGDGHSYENLGQYRVLDGLTALLVKHLVSGVVFYKSVEDFA